jgi:hypothetical protein
MRYSNYIGIFAGLIMILAAVFPWIYITSIDAVVTGFGSEKVTRFGMPALMNMFMIGLAILFFLVQKVWAKKANTFVGAINFAWALRNLLLLSTCRNGECPQTKIWLYVYFTASLILLVMTVLPDMKIIEKK